MTVESSSSPAPVVGFGRSHALAFAREGAKVVVNDLGGAPDGTGCVRRTRLHEVVDEIRAMGGEAVANTDDVADFDAAAGIIKIGGRRRSAASTWWSTTPASSATACSSTSTPDEWDTAIRVHLRGHFCVGRHAAAYWRDQCEGGRTVDARLINTSSGAGLMGSVGQTAYAAAKAGIAAMTIVQAVELGRYGVTVERPRTERAHAAHRRRVRRHDEGSRHRLRRDGSRQHLAVGRVAGQPRVDAT